jgi:phosphoserine phosphatase
LTTVQRLRALATSTLLTLVSTMAALPGWAGDPLSSWRNTPAKRAILTYLSKVTQPGSADFVPASERIAVFDNDGTLWPENPLPFQLAFAIDRLREDIARHPHWQADPFVQAALAGDLAPLVADHYKGLFHIVALTHAGMTTGDFSSRVDRWMATACHPRFARPYDATTYQPMRELLAFLLRNGFRSYIVSGGGADFMRVWSERVYGIPPEHVVGSRGEVVYQLRDGAPVLLKTLETPLVNDGDVKPVSIHSFIGRRPVLAFGNSDGDRAMLEYTTVGNPRPSLGLLLHHTDAEREYAYDANPRSTGRLVRALAEAPERGWVVVNMQRDWAEVLTHPAPACAPALTAPADQGRPNRVWRSR